MIHENHQQEHQGSFALVLAGRDPAAETAQILATTTARVERALARPRRTVADFAALISPAAVPFLEAMARESHRLTRRRFGDTIQVYIPLYLSNLCENRCTYCGFNAANALERKVLDEDAILAEAAVIAARGFKHLLLVTGESRFVGVDYLLRALELLRPRFANLSLEVQPLAEEEYRRLHAVGLHAVMIYQETYDPVVYARVHPSGRKADFAWRLSTPERLGRAGIHKIGIGHLIGLTDWRADACATANHLAWLRRRFWRTRFSISFPRMRPCAGEPDPTVPMTERELAQLICAWRLFDPDVELSLSTRESAVFRDHAIRLGVTAVSAGSRTDVGGYAGSTASLEQFSVHDDRDATTVAAAIKAAGMEVVWKDWDQVYSQG